MDLISVDPVFNLYNRDGRSSPARAAAAAKFVFADRPHGHALDSMVSPA
jgi:hypothetical protein